MNSTTLRGVFPEPKPVYKRNFIKENVKHIKQMQGILQNNKIFESPSVWDEKYRNKPMKNLTTHNAIKLSKSQSRSLPASKLQLQKVNAKKRAKDIDKGKGEIVPPIKARFVTPLEPVEKCSSRAVQTDTAEEIKKLYENGIIKYPSPSVLKALQSSKISPRKKTQTKETSSPELDHGDTGGIIVTNPHTEELSDSFQRLGLNEKHDFIKENIMALKSRTGKPDINQDNAKIQGHQKGTLPKYLRERREEMKRELESDPDCPEGHVLLPEEERKETLRVLRQSYADRIQELNSMPVRNDTLRMRKRKMEIEEELKKIDEGIKVFQRPKVFVKINA